jgi:hypothetical protein
MLAIYELIEKECDIWDDKTHLALDEWATRQTGEITWYNDGTHEGKGFHDLKQDVDCGKVNHVAVYRLSDLCLNSLHLVDWLEKTEVKLEVVSDGFLASDPVFLSNLRRIADSDLEIKHYRDRCSYRSYIHGQQNGKSRHHNAIVTPEMCRQVVAYARARMSQRKIAKRVGVSVSTIGKILHAFLKVEHGI